MVLMLSLFVLFVLAPSAVSWKLQVTSKRETRSFVQWIKCLGKVCGEITGGRVERSCLRMMKGNLVFSDCSKHCQSECVEFIF